jgi:hypothetical protein
MKRYNMKKYCLISTYYGVGANNISSIDAKNKFNYDGDINDLFINFSNKFGPYNPPEIYIGHSKRKDLVYGKIFMLKDYIKDHILNKYEYVCHIDYSDVKFAKSFNGMMEQFEKDNLDFIIATEKICWPYLDVVNGWGEKQLQDAEFHYLNSGCIISKTHLLYEYLEILTRLCLDLNIDFWDDQGVWQYLHCYINSLITDETCKYFFCTALLDNSYYTIDDQGIRTKFNSYPYIIHDNSSFSLNLISTF